MEGGGSGESKKETVVHALLLFLIRKQVFENLDLIHLIVYTQNVTMLKKKQTVVHALLVFLIRKHVLRI